MSFIGRSISIIWFLIKIIIVGLCGAALTTGILAIIGLLVHGSADTGSVGLPAGVLGGGISGYFWGKYFGKIEYRKHEARMNKIGVEVIDNR